MPVQLQLLGTFSLKVNGSVPALRRKTRALVAYLATTARPRSRQTMMNLFCQEAQAPNRVLAVLLSRVRQQLGSSALLSDGETVQLNLAHVAVDIAQFEAILDGNLAEQMVTELETAVSLYRGEFLEGMTLPDAPEFELWLLGQRAHARRLLERGLLALVQRLSERGEYESATRYAHQLLQHNPLLEDAHVQLVWLYAQTGQRQAALRQYDRCRSLLQTELGVEPTSELQTLQAAIVSGELARPVNRAETPVLRQAEAAVFPTPPRLTADFVGRADEYARLQAAWQAAQAGRGATLLIGAPAGGGKTRLMQELIRHLPETAVYTGHCYESTRALPYQPWLEILETHARQLDDAALAQLPSATQIYISRLLPDVARRLAVDQASSASVIDEPERLFTAVVDFLAQTSVLKEAEGGTSQPAPRLLFIDDLQWADETSLRLLHYVSLRIGRFPWLLVGTYRLEEAADEPVLTMLLDDFARRGNPPWQLPPLATAAIAELAAHIWPQLAPAEREQMAERLVAATGGNALFVTAVLQELASSNDVPADLPVPATVQDLLQRRLRRLPPGSRQVLEALAVWGGDASLTQLQQISARGEEEAVQALEWGLQWGLVQANRAARDKKEAIISSPTTYQFHHDLVREAIYATLTAVRQQRLHRRTAQWLARLAQRRPETASQAMAGDSSLAARILYHARRGEAFDLVFRWAPLAAAQARRTFSYRDAIHALDAMRAAYEQIQLSPDFDPDTAEPRLFEQLVWWLSHSWVLGKSPEEERAVLQQAQALLARYPSPLRAAQLRYVTAEITLNFAEAVPVFQEVHRQFLQLEKPELAATALAAAARSSMTLSRNRDGRSLYEQALSLYQQADDQAGEIRCLTGLAWTAVNLGEVAVALDYSQQALSASQAQGDKVGEAQALFSLAAGWAFYHVPDKMADLAAAARRLYRQEGIERGAVRPYLYLGAANDVRGEWPAALAIFEEILETAVAYQDLWVAGWTAQLAGRIYLRWGQLDAAAEKLRQAQQLRLETGERQNQVSDLAWLGRLALAQGETAVALERTAQAIAQLDAFQGEFYVWEQPDVLLCRAEALAAAGEMAEALTIAQRAQATLHRFAQQIDDPDVLARFLAYSLNARVETAVARQKFPLWPDR